MLTFTIKPVLGLKTNVPQDDESLFQFIGQNVALTHAVGGINLDYMQKRNACNKAYGKIQYSASATSDTTYCLGMFEAFDGTNRTHWIFMGDDTSKGRIFRYDSSRAPVRISDVVGHAGATEWAFDMADLYSAIQFGAYMIFTDFGEHTPYKSDYNDTALTKLITKGGATEYKFRYLETFQRRIIGAYSDQTNGDIEIRWTDALPDFAALDFASANQLYKPDDDSITGIRRMGNNACYLYGDNSIDRIIYYADYSTPFGLINMIPNEGAVNHHSIVSMGNAHYFFNKNYGFCKYTGSREFPAGGYPLSMNIENYIRDINTTYHNLIVGMRIPRSNQICWTVPHEGANSPSRLYIYDCDTGMWTIRDHAAKYVVPWLISSNETWTTLIAQGYTTWQHLIDRGMRWTDLFTNYHRLAFSNIDGQVYYEGSTSDNNRDYDAYRIEPIISFGKQQSQLEEIWFSLASTGDYNIYCYYRGGETVGEVENSAWTALPSLSCNNPSEPVIRTMQDNVYHQIKWGTANKNEPFSVNAIELKAVQEGTKY